MDFLVHITFTWPAGITAEDQQRLIAAEGVRARELAAAGTLKRLWRIPGQTCQLGPLGGAGRDRAARGAVARCRCSRTSTPRCIPLAAHPNDPASGPTRPTDDRAARTR